MSPVHNRCTLSLLLLATGFLPTSVVGQGIHFGHFEARIDSVSAVLERPGRLEQALEAYRGIENELLGLNLDPSDVRYRDQQRILASILLRQGNVLRQLGRSHEAVALTRRELGAARASGDPISEARAQFSLGASLLASGDLGPGAEHLERARELFSGNEDPEFRQGLGWYWIIRAELAHAGLLPADPDEVIRFADAALAVLLPLENWVGVARAYGARARAREEGGDLAGAVGDREAAALYGARAGG